MSFNMPKFEIPSDMRDFAEKSVDQARKAFDGFMNAAQKAVDGFQGQANSVQANAAEFTKKAISQAESNLTSAFDHAQRLVRAKDPQEVMQIQAEYLKQQLAQIQSQMRDLGSSVQTNLKEFASTAQSNVNAAMETAKSVDPTRKK